MFLGGLCFYVFYIFRCFLYFCVNLGVFCVNKINFHRKNFVKSQKKKINHLKGDYLILFVVLVCSINTT